MVKINSYDELVNSVKNRHSIPSSSYKKFGTTLYDVYVSVFGNQYCKECKKEMSEQQFISLNKGFKECCSLKCTNLYKYGVSCPLNTESSKEKRKETLMEKYGVINISQINEVKQKKTNTFLEKYGVENPSQINEVKQKRKETIMEKYGVEYYSQCEDFLTKVYQTSKEKYGVKHFTQSDIVKENAKKDIHYSQRHINNLENYNQSYIDLNFIENKKFKIKDAMDYFNVSSTILHRRFDVPKTMSIPESELLKLIPNSILNDRQIINPLEIDILSHEYKFGIEYNGLMWHSSGKASHNFPIIFPKNKHKEKSDRLIQKGYMLYHIFENEWLDTAKKDIWISMINEKQNKNIIINGDDCSIKILNDIESYDFLEKYHLFGSYNSKINIALYYNNDIVQLISIENKCDLFEITRIANKNGHFIKNGLKILINELEKQYSPNIIKYVADKRFTDPDIILDLGFEICDILEPSGYYFNHKDLQLIDENNAILNENEMYNLNYRKIYDAGHYIFKKEILERKKNECK